MQHTTAYRDSNSRMHTPMRGRAVAICQRVASG